MRRLLIFLIITIVFITVINSETSECEGEEEETYKIKIFFEGLDINEPPGDSIRVFYKDGGSEYDEIGGKCKYDKEKHMFEIPVSTKKYEQFDVRNCYLCFDNIEGYKVDHVHFPEFIERKQTKFAHNGDDIICYRLAVSGTGKEFDCGEKNTIIMNPSKPSKGIVRGEVCTRGSDEKVEPIYFSGVKVSLCKDGKEVASGISERGEYSITYKTGVYDIKFNLSGYKTCEKKGIVISDEEEYVFNADLKAENGVDVPHSLMIIGGVVAVVILVIAIIHRALISRTYRETNSSFKR